MHVIAYLAVSLDGYIADRDGSVEWLNAIPNPDGDDYGFAEFMGSVDALLMGANTFRVVESFGVWPYDKPVFVASRSILEPPPGYADKITLMNGEVSDLLTQISALGYERIYVDGGQIIQAAMRANLLSELILTQIPISLGDGIPLFPKSEQQRQFTHTKTEVVGPGLVKSWYTL
ncbi:dihydrofolate reductase family protein [Coraliomargarita akajimensis]|uniref:Bifunctional deaminase-reductase domain protein n=1 Tax=Coraliomargarita akajimensis (strain DSM 45221 / IAM 15411 / JCM 23193 / KCTC 12865 / 04OKA010-24) TaxID=583355 RepID=D5ER53_CORAD|nr:dihydrofolate reductase family protein [Coraliomargarita akajimensis]ADE55897.1 bifunctional deaminase-reductase domain protein [Coraliomargarita akajimensis DSM 45221]